MPCLPTLIFLAKSSGQDLCVWSIEPALPAGLNINPASGLISGCGKEEVAETTYAVTARNEVGSRTSQFTLGVGLTPPSSFTYDLPCKDVLQIGETVSCFPTLTVLAKSSGQDLCVWSVEPALPQVSPSIMQVD